MPEFFTKYNPPKVPGWNSEQESRVQEQFADACQTDTIIRKYNMMGVNPFIASGSSQYLDTTEIPSFVAAQNSQVKVREYFEGLPSDVRLEFNNDPSQFAEAVLDPRNADYLREIGVLAPLPPRAEGEKQPASSGDNFEKAPHASEGSDLFAQKEPEKAVSPEKSNG
uniref:Internal scaffolding protein n=1 Tax=Dulem virus 105 TaxID=3145582 RepID=A0AAU8B016_9VIRU